MKLSSLLVSVIFFLFSTLSMAAQPPSYLTIPHWQKCTTTFSKGTYKFICLPPGRPNGCPEASWRSLTRGEMLPFCPLCPLKPLR